MVARHRWTLIGVRNRVGGRSSGDALSSAPHVLACYHGLVPIRMDAELDRFRVHFSDGGCGPELGQLGGLLLALIGLISMATAVVSGAFTGVPRDLFFALLIVAMGAASVALGAGLVRHFITATTLEVDFVEVRFHKTFGGMAFGTRAWPIHEVGLVLAQSAVVLRYPRWAHQARRSVGREALAVRQSLRASEGRTRAAHARRGSRRAPGAQGHDGVRQVLVGGLLTASFHRPSSLDFRKVVS